MFNSKFFDSREFESDPIKKILIYKGIGIVDTLS